MDFLIRFAIGWVIGLVLTPFLAGACRIGFGVLFDVLMGGRGPSAEGQGEQVVMGLMYLIFPVVSGLQFAMNTPSN